MSITDRIADTTELREVYRTPSQGAIDKVIDHVDEGAADFIAASPFMIMATATSDRADASPRGGPVGFVRVLDDNRIAWGDLTGNNRLDSFENVLASPHVGLLFLVPGVVETLRIAGRASLVRSPDVLEACAIDDRLPKVAVVVQVDECYIQCGAAVRRGSLWDTDTWIDETDRPRGAAILKGHTKTPASVDDIEAGLGDYYDNHIWGPGGSKER